MPDPSPREPETAIRELTADLPLPPSQAAELVAGLCEQWGGEIERTGTGGRFALPASAGLRHGILEGEVSVSRLGDEGSRVVLRIDAERYRVHVSAVVVLLIGAAGGLFLMVAPLILGPSSIGLLPAAFFVMLAAWFLVVSRVRHRGAGELLEEIEAAASTDHGP